MNTKHVPPKAKPSPSERIISAETEKPAAVKSESKTPVLETAKIEPKPAADVVLPGMKALAKEAQKEATKPYPSNDPKREETMHLTGNVNNGKKSGIQKILSSLNSFGLGKEKMHFIENLAILLNSGLTVIDALKTVEVELRVKPMKKIAKKIIEEVESGIALWRAMDNQNFFSPYALSLIRIGEEAGSLSKNMEYLAVQQEKDRSLRSKVKMAMIYPSIVLTLTIGITLGLAWFVLPKLVGVLLSLNAELPLVTIIIIWIANFFSEQGTVAVPLFAVLVILIVVICKYTPLRGPSQMLVFRFPGIGTMARSATIAQFGVILGSLLKAGVPLVESIRSMADVTDTVYYRRFYYKLAGEIEVGQSFAASFRDLKETTKLFPRSVQQLIVTGEKSGRIADMLMRVADIYEKKAEEAAQRLPVVLEPILLIFIGSLVGTIAFAIIVPIYSIVGNVGR